MATGTPHRRHPVRLRLGPPGRRRVRLGDGAPPSTDRHYGFDALAEDVIAARHLIAADLPDQARALLATNLDRLDLQRASPDPVLIDAGILYASLTTGERQLTIARYAYHAAARLYKRQHPRRLAATSILATALHQARRYGEAIDLRYRLALAYDDLGLHADAMRSRASLVDCLRADGRCDAALNIIETAWLSWRMQPDLHGGPTVGAAVLRTYLRALAGCRRPAELSSVLDQASHTPLNDADRRTLRQVPADAGHITGHRLVCTHRPPRSMHAEPRDLA